MTILILSPDGWGCGGGWGKIEIKDQLRLAEAETGAELGNTQAKYKHCTTKKSDLNTFEISFLNIVIYITFYTVLDEKLMEDLLAMQSRHMRSLYLHKSKYVVCEKPLYMFS